MLEQPNLGCNLKLDSRRGTAMDDNKVGVRDDGPICQAISAVGRRLQELSDGIALLETILKLATCMPRPTSEEKGPCTANPGDSQLSNMLWEIEGHIDSQRQSIKHLTDSIEI